MKTICADCGRTVVCTKLDVNLGNVIFNPELEQLSKHLCLECLFKQLDGVKEKLRLPGIATVVSMIVIAIIMLTFVIIPNLRASRRAANESAVLGSMRTIGSAQATYFSTVGGNTTYATTLSDLRTAGLIDSVLAAGTKSGYTFTMRGSGATFTATASPQAGSGTRSFFTDESGVIRSDASGMATVDSPAMQ